MCFDTDANTLIKINPFISRSIKEGRKKEQNMRI